MNCCDEYGNCRQGRDCPVRKQASCQWCKGTGIDETGAACVCSKHHWGDTLAVILLILIAALTAFILTHSLAGR